MKLIKKSLFILGVLSLAGCSSPQNTAPVPNATPSQNAVNDPSLSTSNQKLLTEEEVKAIVLAEVPNGKIIEFDSDLNTLSPNYDVTVIDGNTEYEFEIDGYTGTVRKIEKDFDANADALAAANVSVEDAKVIALAEVPDAKIISIDYEEDAYLPYYEICLKSGDYEYDLEIDAKTGEIRKIEKELFH